MTAVVDKKLMANARLTALFDEGTLTYVASQVDGIGAVSATGKINGRTVVAFANDPSFQGGALGAAEGAFYSRRKMSLGASECLFHAFASI